MNSTFFQKKDLRTLFHLLGLVFLLLNSNCVSSKILSVDEQSNNTYWIGAKAGSEKEVDQLVKDLLDRTSKKYSANYHIINSKLAINSTDYYLIGGSKSYFTVKDNSGNSDALGANPGLDASIKSDGYYKQYWVKFDKPVQFPKIKN